MSEISILMSLKDMVSTALTKIMELFGKFKGETQDLEKIHKQITQTIEDHYKILADSAKTTLSDMLSNYRDHYNSLATLLDEHITKQNTLIISLEDQKDAIKELTKTLPSFSVKLSDVSSDLSSVASMAAAAARQVANLRAEIAALKSKTIVITIVRRTVTVSGTATAGAGAGASAGSNPFTARPGIPSTAADKVFTERRILPALKTLAREGKVSKEVVLT